VSALSLHRATGCQAPLHQVGAGSYEHRGYRVVQVAGAWHVRRGAELVWALPRLTDALAFVDAGSPPEGAA
jgi:hypothetical protein